MKNNSLSKRSFSLIFIVSFIFVIFLKDLFGFESIFKYIVGVHEMCHALFSLLTGGNVVFINLHNHGGMTGTQGGFFPLISMGGYIGTTIIGLSLLISSKKENVSKFMIRFLSLLMIVFYILYIESYFDYYFILIIVFSLILILISMSKYSDIFAVVLGSIFILDSFSDAKIYLFSKITGTSNIIYKTDAGILARWLGLEILALPIAIIIFSINIFFIYITFKYLFKREEEI